MSMPGMLRNTLSEEQKELDEEDQIDEGLAKCVGTLMAIIITF